MSSINKLLVTVGTLIILELVQNSVVSSLYEIDRNYCYEKDCHQIVLKLFANSSSKKNKDNDHNFLNNVNSMFMTQRFSSVVFICKLLLVEQ